MPPKISVLVATRDREKLIRGCLESLAQQTLLKQIEILVIDGDSKENEKAVVSEFLKRFPQIRYLSTKKLGLYHAWNLGIQAARGTYLTNLNTDDRLKKDALEILAQALDDRPEIAVVYADSLVTDMPDETFENNSSRKRCLRWPDYSHKELLIQCLCGPHPMWRKKLHDEFGYFDENLKIAGDYDFWLNVAEKYKFYHLQKTLGLYYENTKGLLLSDLDRAQEETQRVKLKHLFHGRAAGGK